MLITELTMNEFADQVVQTPSVILPVGSLEEHGPHLPLGLDTMHAFDLARRTADLRPVLVAPPLWYGLCRSSSRHPGTVGITGLTLQNQIYDIGINLWKQGVNYLCLLTGHAGGTHQAMLIEAGERLLADSGLQVASVCVLDLLDGAKDLIKCAGDSHAGEVETSLALALWPDLVRGSAPEEYPTFPRFLLVRDKRAHWPGGVWGDPSLADADKGKKLLDIEARALAKVLDALEALGPGPGADAPRM